MLTLLKTKKLICLSVFALTCFSSFGLAEEKPGKQVSVVVMPFWGTDLSDEDRLIAIATRDRVLHKLVEDPSIRLVIRRRAYALSLDSEIVIDDPSSTKYRTAADYVIFGHLLPQKTGQTNGFDCVIGVYDVSSGALISIENVASGSASPRELAADFFASLKETLNSPESPPDSVPARAIQRGMERIVVLPVWVMGGEEYDFNEVASQLSDAAKRGLQAGWPNSPVVSTEEVIQILDDNGLNRPGDRADAYAENVARFLNADQVILINLNHNPEEGQSAWDLALMGIDIETGIVTHTGAKSYTSLEALLNGTRNLAFELTRSEVIATAPFHSRGALGDRLNKEGQLYASLAVDDAWEKKWPSHLSVDLRIEMAEMAISTIPEIRDEELLRILEESYGILLGVPDQLNLYQDYRGITAADFDPFTLNRAADFMHLSLNAHPWQSLRTRLEARKLKIKLLTLMGQPQEARDYLNLVSKLNPDYPEMNANILMLEGRHREVMDSVEKIKDKTPRDFKVLAMAARQIGDHKTEYEALKMRMIKQGGLDHRRTSERTIFLMNEFENPEKRIELVEKYASRWSKGTDVSQYTLARAKLQTAPDVQSISILRSLHKKHHLGGILKNHVKPVREEITSLLEPHGGVNTPRVKYKDVNLPPEGAKFYVQPIGYTDLDSLELAVKRCSIFSGFEFVLLPNMEAPLHEEVYDLKNRQYDARNLQKWLAGTYQVPDDAVHCAFVFGADIAWNGGWIYSNTEAHGWTVMSDFRWRSSYKNLERWHKARALAKVWLAAFQYPMKEWFGRSRIEEITGQSSWPNHAGTIQYSKGTSYEVFEAEFNLCESTQKLYRAVDWNELRAFKQVNFQNYVESNGDAIQHLSREVGLPVIAE